MAVRPVLAMMAVVAGTSTAARGQLPEVLPVDMTGPVRDAPVVRVAQGSLAPGQALAWRDAATGGVAGNNTEVLAFDCWEPTCFGFPFSSFPNVCGFNARYVYESCSQYMVNDMTVDAVFHGATVTRVSYGFTTSTPVHLVSEIFTAEDYDDTCTSGHGGVIDQIFVDHGVLDLTGTYMSNRSLADLGLTLHLPADGTGAYGIRLWQMIDFGVLIVPPCAKVMMWGTGDGQTPQLLRPGTQGPGMWVDYNENNMFDAGECFGDIGGPDCPSTLGAGMAFWVAAPTTCAADAGCCLVPHCNPYCDDPDCCAAVCAVLPECCVDDWDEACAAEALALCTSGCGSPGAGDCNLAHATPGCAIAACCSAVCCVDPFCCDVEWDGLCVDGASTYCGTPGEECSSCVPTGEGAIAVDLTDNVTGFAYESGFCGGGGAGPLDEWYCYTPSCTGIATASICTAFAGADIAISAFESCTPGLGDNLLACGRGNLPGCTDFGATANWVAIAGRTYYVRLSHLGETPAEAFIGTVTIACDPFVCGHPEVGNCYTEREWPFCDDTDCCITVCVADPFCCDNAWDGLCVDEAGDLCGGCGAPASGDCLAFNGTPGCLDAGCCVTVCAGDPFCCDGFWDNLCADAAAATCCLADGNGDGEVDVNDLVAVISNWGPCPGCPADVNGDGEVGVDDLVYVITQWGDCE